MRLFLILVACAVLGMVGVVVMHESQRGGNGGSSGGVASSAAIETVSTGEAVDLESIIPREGLTIVCFCADF